MLHVFHVGGTLLSQSKLFVAYLLGSVRLSILVNRFYGFCSREKRATLTWLYNEWVTVYNSEVRGVTGDFRLYTKLHSNHIHLCMFMCVIYKAIKFR